jgi:hypothetical protein
MMTETVKDEIQGLGFDVSDISLLLIEEGRKVFNAALWHFVNGD